VGIMQGFGDRCYQLRGFMKTAACFSDRGSKIASIDELRYHEAKACVGAPHVVDGDDMGLVKCRDDSGFVEARLNLLGS
jgi:hypothetical protein